MDSHDSEMHDEPQEIDLRSLKRALMRRDEAVERFRAAKAQLLRPRPEDEARGHEPSR